MSFGWTIAYRKTTCFGASMSLVAAVLDDVRGQLKAYCSEIGRPSVDPELMIRM